jgi:hypothetical protein
MPTGLTTNRRAAAQSVPFAKVNAIFIFVYRVKVVFIQVD